MLEATFSIVYLDHIYSYRKEVFIIDYKKNISIQEIYSCIGIYIYHIGNIDELKKNIQPIIESYIDYVGYMLYKNIYLAIQAI